MTLLSLVDDAADRIGIVRPGTVIASQDQQTLALLGFAQQEGRDLARQGGWQALTNEVTFTSLATETQTGIVPADFDYILNDTFYNRTQKRPINGPLNAQQWQFEKSVTAAMVFQKFRFRGGSVLISPTPAAGDTYAFEYISKNWCQSNAAVEQSSWAADTDTAILDEELITLGLVWRFKQAKGLDYAEAFRTYQLQVKQALMRDGGKPRLDAASMSLSFNQARGLYVPDGSWPL